MDTGKFARKMDMVDRLGKIEEKSANILFKDHKRNFLDNKQARLINTKTGLGFISKDLIQRITSRLLSGHKYNLWKNSMDTIDWFKNIRDKKRSTFIQFVIIEFYPSITRELLLKSLNHAREYTDITEEVEIILACRKSVLSDNRRTWVKSHVDNFDVIMGAGAYDSAQVADLVGIYIRWVVLSTWSWWAFTEMTKLSSSRTVTARILGLRIEIASNLEIVDVTLNLNNGTFKPFSKNDSAPRYINISSNHPRSVMRQILNAVNQRIKRLSSCKIIFEESKDLYDDALKNSGFQGRQEYLTLVDLGSEDKGNNGGTRTPIKVGEINNNNNNH